MREKLALTSCLTIVLGLVFSKFLITVGIILLSVSAFLSSDIKSDFKKLISNPALFSGVGIFLIVAISGSYTQNFDNQLSILRIMLPFLILPLAFGLLPNFNKKQFNCILYFFVLLMSAASVWVLIQYLSDIEFYQYQISISKVLPTPQRDHIRFSLMMAIAVFSAGYLIKEKFYLQFKKTENLLLWILTIFLMVMLHVMAVRSGLLALYAGIFVAIIQYIFLKKAYLKGLILIIGLIALPLLALQMIPSFKQKISLMKYNLEKFNAGEIEDLSDTQRLLSYRVALKVGSKNPWIGVGMGDLKDEQERIYISEYPQQRVMQPHNQFISFYAGTGILGLIGFFAVFLFPIFYRKKYLDSWFLLFMTVIFSSFLTENTLFVSIGVNLYAFFMTLFLNISTKKAPENNSGTL